MLSADDVRAEVRTWLEEHWGSELPLREWRNLLVDSGWACPTWPAAWYGRDLPADMGAVVNEEFDRLGAVGAPTGVAMGLAAPTILAHGSTELKTWLLRPILTGEHTWCQLFSEPGSGSDLAGLTTHAIPDGNEWVINGQKVWSTNAHHADYGLLLARTNWDIPKHRGITCFALPMRQPGVEVRPLRQMNGYSSFNEVFLTDARSPAEHVIGTVGNGWAVAVTTLTLERRVFATFGRRRVVLGAMARAVREAEAEAEEYFRTYQWYPQRTGRADLVVERARVAGRDRDPVVRQKIAALLAMQCVARWTAERARVAQVLGRSAGAEGSLGKISTSNIARAAAEVHAMISGPLAMLSGADAPLDGLVTEVLLSVPAISIAGGTDEIQRNIISERVLGLPKEPQVDRDLRFRDVPRHSR